MTRNFVGYHFGRAISSVVVPLDWQTRPEDWETGPLPEKWRVGTGKQVTGATLGRLAYMNDGLEPVLYRRVDRDVLRWHKIVGTKIPGKPMATLNAVEVLRVPLIHPYPSALLVLHIAFDAKISGVELRRMLNYVTNHNTQHAEGARAWVDSLVEPWAKVNLRHRRSQHSTLITRSTAGWPSTKDDGLGGFETTESEWLFALASSGRTRPDPESFDQTTIRGSETHLIWMSDNLRGIVSRDGFAMIGLKKDTGGEAGAHGFDYDGAQFFTRGLYIDVLLLSCLQRFGLDAISFDVTRLYATGANTAKLLTLEGAVGLFRTHIWRRDFAPQGSQDEVLGKLQDVQGLVQREADVSRNLSELSARVTRTEQASIGELLRLLTLVGFFWGFIWALLSELKVEWNPGILIVVAVGVGIWVARHPGLSLAIGRRRKRRAKDLVGTSHIDSNALS